MYTCGIFILDRYMHTYISYIHIIHKYTYIYMHTYIYICIQTYIHIYVCIQTPTHTNIYERQICTCKLISYAINFVGRRVRSGITERFETRKNKDIPGTFKSEKRLAAARARETGGQDNKPRKTRKLANYKHKL